MQQAALAEDPSIFDYDSHVDSIQERREGPKEAERQARKSRYIEGLLDKAKERQKEQDIVYERRFANPLSIPGRSLSRLSPLPRVLLPRKASFLLLTMNALHQPVSALVLYLLYERQPVSDCRATSHRIDCLNFRKLVTYDD